VLLHTTTSSSQALHYLYVSFPAGSFVIAYNFGQLSIETSCAAARCCCSFSQETTCLLQHMPMIHPAVTSGTATGAAAEADACTTAPASNVK